MLFYVGCFGLVLGFAIESPGNVSFVYMDGSIVEHGFVFYEWSGTLLTKRYEIELEKCEVCFNDLKTYLVT